MRAAIRTIAAILVIFFGSAAVMGLMVAISGDHAPVAHIQLQGQVSLAAGLDEDGTCTIIQTGMFNPCAQLDAGPDQVIDARCFDDHDGTQTFDLTDPCHISDAVDIPTTISFDK